MTLQNPPDNTPIPTEPRGASSDGSSDNRRRILLETLAVFGLATLICSVLWQLRRFVPFINRNLHGLIAAVFLYLPTYLLSRKKRDFTDYGLTLHPVGRGLVVFLLASSILFPLFSLGFYAYYRVVCAAAASGASLPAQIRGLCRHFVGDWRTVRLHLPAGFAQIALAQILVVALPEEYFFRGYLQTRLEAVWPTRRQILGQPVGLSVLATSLLFALGHLLVDFNGLRLAVFFPSLIFGWMRQVTGSIAAGVLFHACCNMISEVLHGLFF